MADSLTVLVSLSIRGSLILLAAFMFAPLFKDAPANQSGIARFRNDTVSNSVTCQRTRHDLVVGFSGRWSPIYSGLS
jgi:hypothetical protein